MTKENLIAIREQMEEQYQKELKMTIDENKRLILERQHRNWLKKGRFVYEVIS